MICTGAGTHPAPNPDRFRFLQRHVFFTFFTHTHTRDCDLSMQLGLSGLVISPNAIMVFGAVGRFRRIC